MELFEELDDQGFTANVVGSSYAVRWQIPVTRVDAASKNWQSLSIRR